MKLFRIVKKTLFTREEEIAILHNKGRSEEYLITNLLYDREWCGKHGIRYYDLKSSSEKSAEDIARDFVEAAIQKYNSEVICVKKDF